MTQSEFMKKHSLSSEEFEYYIERTAIMQYEGDMAAQEAHIYVLEDIRRRR